MTAADPPPLPEALTSLANVLSLWDGRPIPPEAMSEVVRHARAVAAAHTQATDPDITHTQATDDTPATADDVADHLTVRTLHLADTPGVAAMVFDFASSWTDDATAEPVPVGSHILIAPPDVMRSAGKVMRDTANAAANRAENR